MKRQCTINAMPDILSVADVCFLMSVSRPTVLKIAKEEGSPFFKIGQNWKVLKQELIEFLKKRSHEQT